jgi:hypothetical protein
MPATPLFSSTVEVTPSSDHGSLTGQRIIPLSSKPIMRKSRKGFLKWIESVGNFVEDEKWTRRVSSLKEMA